MPADILISIVTAVGFALTGIYVALARWHRPTWKAGVVMLIACSELTLAHALQGLSADFTAKVFWYKLIYVGFTITPTAFLVLALLLLRLVPCLLTLLARLPGLSRLT